ncbi:MAG TPA: NADP-dependent phosphogluconate dehydrogenase [Steroidobacteraceae bacterium]|nr:NADP-dependent phosphogluconate dehydrogenase [Steroidobacteraceae bacterium]
MSSSTFGIVGLGRMGGNLARLAVRRGLGVVGYAQGPGPRIGAGFRRARSLAELCRRLPRPRRILLYVPAGPVVDELLGDLAALLARGDVIADGGNSYWGDSIRREAALARHGIDFIDVGTSGGVEGATSGACFMAGGRARGVRQFAPILKRLAVPGGYVHAGGPGTGHFVKLVHNGIEFGMLQAIGEGVALLASHPSRLSIGDVLACWRHGSVIRSWLLDLLEAQYRRQGGLGVPPIVDDTGEVNWLVDDAMRLEVPVPVIAQSVMQLIASRDRHGDAARAIAMMRHGFGGHPFGRDARVERERRTGRVGGFVAPARGRAS